MQQFGLNNVKLFQHVMLKQLPDFQQQQIGGLGFNDIRSFNNESAMGMNWVQGGIPHGHSLQDAHSSSPNPVQVDVSLYGSSVGSGRSGMNPCSGVHLQSAYLTATSHSDKDQKIITQLQGFKNPFVDTCSQDHYVMLQGLPKKNPLMSSSVLGLNGDSSSVQDQENLLGMQQKPRLSSQASVALDPLEEKILYHTDDNVQDCSFGRNKNEIGSRGFSLSALMQCALEEETGPLDGNGNDQIPNVHSFTSGVENACTKSSGISQLVIVSPGMNQSSLASPSSVHSKPYPHDLSQHAHCANKSDIPGEAEMSALSGTGYVQGQTHMQVICKSSLPSYPSDLSTSYDFLMNTPAGQHQLVDATNNIPMTVPMVQRKPSEEIGCTVGEKLQEENSSLKMLTNGEPGLNSNLKHVTSVETEKSLCLQSLQQLPNGLVPIGETRSKGSTDAWHPSIGPSNSAVQYLDALNQNMVALRPKKRKSTTFWQSPWHKVVLQGSDMSQSIRMSEQEWALATNRPLEKVEEMVSASEPIPPLKRRMILSTQLMQQLLPPAPSFTLRGNAADCYESVLYFVSRIALSDACSLVCYGRNSLHSHSDTSKKISEKIETPKKTDDADQQYAQVGKVFVEKIQKLESDFQRLDTTASIVDIIVEIQDLERFSVINRFAKFHSRVQANSSGCSSSPAMSKSVPQRYVTGLLLPKTLPEGVHCLPL